MESEFCEIDFTTATMWENFTARLEEIFYSWKLYQSEEDCILECCEIFSCELGSWSLKKEKISLGGKEQIFYLFNLGIVFLGKLNWSASYIHLFKIV